MNFTKSQLIVFGAIALLIIILVLIFTGVLPGLKSKNQPQAISAQIQVWGVFDKNKSYNALFATLKQTYPQVTISFRGFENRTDYETTLLDALASGRGPDIFMIRNNALPKEINKIVPVPKTLFSLINLQESFPQIVEQDFALQGTIYALPLSIDTLALIYNRDLLDQAAVAPPQTWEDLVKTVPALRKTDSAKKITLAAAALGGAENINNVVDVLNLLMLQAGTKMVKDDFSAATFNSPEGINALSFYAGFGDTKNNNYTWNAGLPHSLDAFSQGTVAMIFDYESAIPQIKMRNSFINLGVAGMLQPQNSKKTISYPNYWGFTVSRQSRNANLAWNIILAMAVNPQNAKTYLDASGKPPALRSLVNSYLQDPLKNVFAKQILIARSWPQTDAKAIEQIFLRTIKNVLAGAEPQTALKQAEEQVTQFMARTL